MAIDLSAHTKDTIGKFFDHSVLPKNSTEDDIRQGCRIAKQYDTAAFYASSGYWLDVMKEELADSDVLIATGVDFPWGAQPTTLKAAETEYLVKKGAQALDICINVGAARSGHWDVVEQDLRAFKDAAGGAVTKAILEVCFLTDDEITRAATLVAEAGLDYVKTSSGQFEGPSMEQFLVMKRAVAGSSTRTKVAGVKFPRPQNAYAFILAGAELIGTRATPQIVEAFDSLREIGLIPGGAQA
ncbi:deoxyribose-phosphate aldolase [Propionibacteriaceae bacterium Y1923]|uniref:deoxyribose-phosphate aldolase n=1 Tax=Aestuariimicrobium sp. Y1814 TaxID=3418742 RepID=UPI003C183583